jgi:integrase
LTARGVRETDPMKRHPVGPRSIAKELKVLRAACRRATIERTVSGDFPLTADPTRGLELPVERNPRRPVCESERLEALTAVADRVRVRSGWGRQAHEEPTALPTLLRLAGDTGRRIGAILALRWSDWRPDRGTYGMLRWRAEEDKVRREWWVPVTPDVREALELLRRTRPGVGDALLFPGPNNPAAPVTIQLATSWLRRAEELAGLSPLTGGVWHPFRPAWATARKHLSPKDVAAVGGWVDTTTLQKCYQAPDRETMQEVILQPRAVLRVQA